MYPITNEVMALFESEQRKVLRITGTDRNGTTISITDNNVMADSFQIDRYACNGEKLEVGTAIAAQLTLKLENGNGQYDGIVFEGAELFVEVGIADWTQSSPTVTYIPCGYFTPDEQPRRLSTISITALDRMTKFDAVVDGTQITTPITVANLVAVVGNLRGVYLAQSITGLTNANVSLPSIPSGNSVTYRNLIAWCAGIMGTNAWIDWNGQLRFSWYNNATGYASTVDNRYSSDMYENDLTVTGVVYTTTGGIDIVEGTDDYALDLTGNTLAAPMITTILPALNTALNGFTYRPFTAAAVNAPYLWPMDAVTFTDKEGNDHASLLTNVCFGLNGTTAMEARGMTYVLNRQKLPEGFTKEQAQLINEVSNQIKDDIDDSLTQQDIFNRLTENGAAQGLVLYNGQLYINASYIQSGTLVLGGANNQNGTLKVLNAAGQEIGTWTKDGISIQRGDINLDSSGSIKVGFDAQGTMYALFNNQGMKLMLENGSIVATGKIRFGNSDYYPVSTDLGTLVARYTDGTEEFDTTIGPGYLNIFHSTNNTGDHELEYNIEGLRISGPAGAFEVNSDDGEVNTSYEFKLGTPLGISYGGTGATTPALVVTNQYVSIEEAINEVRGSRVFPISLQKNGTRYYGDMPSGYEQAEWNMELVGDSTRLTAFMFVYGQAAVYKRDFYNGSWNGSWQQIAPITPANIGAVAKTGDTMTGPLTMDSNLFGALGNTGFRITDESGALSYLCTADDFYGSGGGWNHFIICNHGNGATYYNYVLRLPFWGSPKYKRQMGSTSGQTPWYDFLTSEKTVTVLQGGTGATYGTIDITDFCTFPTGNVNTSSPYGGRLYYNPYLNCVFGTITMNDGASVNNQADIVYLKKDASGTVLSASREATCGTCVHSEVSPVAVPRITGNTIKSSHTLDNAITSPRYTIMAFLG